MFKKLGTQITIIIAAIVVVMVATILAATLIQFRSYNDGILVERANVGVHVLEKEFENIQTNLNEKFEIFAEDKKFNEDIKKADTEAIEQFISTELDAKRNFAIVADSSGTQLYATSSNPLTSFDSKSEINGILSTKDALVIICSNKLEDGYLSLGYVLNEDTWLESVKKTGNCDVTVFHDNLRYQTTLGANLVGTPMGDAIKKAVIDGSASYSGQAVINNKPYYVAYTPMYDYQKTVVGAYFAGSDASVANDEFTRVTGVAIIIGVVWAIIIIVFLLIFSRKRIASPLKEAEQYAVEMRDGILDTTSVTFKFADDEIGHFITILKEAKDNMNLVVTDASNILNTMAQGDFTKEPTAAYPGVFNGIKESFYKIEADIGNTLKQMNGSADEVLSGSEQLAEGSQALADGTTKQASAIEEISATITDVSSQIAKTAQNAAEAGEISANTLESVNQQDTEIQSMVAAMDEISQTSKEIEKIIKAIEDISFQTNILALNAAVEAARAGDAGKGFAVVADEVRNLANKSAEASGNTAQLINASIEAVDKGSKIALSTVESMKSVKDMSTQQAAIISEIARASQEQNESIKQITSGIEQISQVIQTNSATAEETAASCEELSGQAKYLKDQVERFTF